MPNAAYSNCCKKLKRIANEKIYFTINNFTNWNKFV